MTRKTLIRKLDQVSREIVIKRDGACVVCGATTHLTPGHLFSRRHLATRWDLMNVNCQCLSCNLKHVRDQVPYIIWFIDRYSLKELEELRAKHYQVTHYKLHDLENIHEGLKEKYANL